MSRICHHCVGERVLKAEIRADGERDACDWCDRTAQTWTAERLAERVATVYEREVGPADEGFRQVAGHASWGPNGRPPSELMTELIEADDDHIGRELVEILARRNAWGVNDGAFDFYDEESENYDFVYPADVRLRTDWLAFCERLRHGSRFFGSHAALDAIFAPILTGRFARRSVRQIVPGGPLSTLYRGRLANDDLEQRKIYGQPLTQLAAPPPGVAGAGRMNAAGISVFYGASDVDTCLAELRTPVGGAAVIGRFEVIRPLRLLDLAKLEKIGEQLSPFDDNYVERLGWQHFIQGFHDEIKRAVIPGRETLDYLPTQAVAEYLWTRPDPLDGIVFGSAQISGAHRNVVLFPHACLIEGVALEAERKVLHIWNEGPSEDDEDREVVSKVYIAALPAAPEPEPSNVQVFEDEDWFASHTAGAADPNGSGPSLRLAADGIERVSVEAIRLKSTSVPVHIEEWRDDPRL